MNDINKQPTIQERLDTGEITFVSNLLNPGVMPAPASGALRPREEILQGLRQHYGEEAVVTGDAFDPQAEKVADTPDMIGVYVTTKAIEAAQQAQAEQV
ncbi:MAG: hypothetical protein ACHQT9_01795 [Candidatus Saccharimonadales bacterium]